MIKNFGYHLIEENDSLLLAVSGGIDSMVMLDIIFKLKRKYKLNLYIAHVDHQKRASSVDDKEFVIERAKELEIPYFVENLEHNNEENFHDYAHKKRYDFFYQVAKENKINKVVLAHNANDNAETILMRLTRGSSFEGYRGILENNFYKDLEIIRPLLHLSREDIEIYQQVNLVPYQNDPSNDTDDYTRNRYRHHLLPLIESENPRYLEKISQFSYYQNLSYKLIDKISDKFLNKLNFSSEITIKVEDFLEEDKIIQIEIIKKVINKITNNCLELSLQNILDIIELFLNIKPHLQFIIEDKLYVYKSYNFITFRTDEYQVKEYNFEITDFGEYKLPNGDLISITKNANKNYGFIYKLCYNNLDLVFPLTVRNRLDGDRLKLSSGTKKLKDVFIDKKVPMLDRDSLPIFVNKNDEIVYIPGIYKMDSQGENSLYIIVRKD